MKKLIFFDGGKETFIDFSQERELVYWSTVLNVKPESIKSAARACCSNEVSQITAYLKQSNRK
ncbi:hypothetical protein [Pedobacter nyackensis]|uniref:DUF3606 domain-containing protein n=1 Tax=Pedobacter nyackensis TaxID=475255 RepID=A0A1W2EL64_9SPHI|nr:hypothetical protein [Pedobacter nyackensis]SMD10450.1 hypothetical protein SAMN04488101_113102 [Pedobacter nyackensis]